MFDRVLTHDAATLTTAGGAGFALFGEAVQDTTMYNGGLWVSLIGLAFIVARTTAEYLADRRRQREREMDELRREVERQDEEIRKYRERVWREINEPPQPSPNPQGQGKP